MNESLTSAAQKIAQIIEPMRHIVVLQADNPDGDSLSSALALEAILSDAGKQVSLYCGVDIPEHLKFVSGWDRVSRELPHSFDGSIIVDTSTITLFDALTRANNLGWLGTKPCIVIDHHADVPCDISYATVVLNHGPAVATGEVIFELAQLLGWQRAADTNDLLAVSILADSLGLMSEGVTPRTMAIIAQLTAEGVSLAKLDTLRRQLMKKSAEMTAYKGRLLQRIEYFDDNRIACITIPFDEIEKYSHEYNPSVLVLEEMRMVTGVEVAIAYKVYPDRVTAKIRCNPGYGIGNLLAEQFGGGGHPYAAGFKDQKTKDYSGIKSKSLQIAAGLLRDMAAANQESTHATV